MEFRLAYDLCTPTIDRRPTKPEDIYEDVHVEEFKSKKDLVEKLNELCDYELFDNESWNEVNLDLESASERQLDWKINEAIDMLEDPGDGTPNIIFIVSNGKVLYTGDNLEGINPLTADERQVQKASIAELDNFYPGESGGLTDEEGEAEDFDECLSEDTHNQYAKPEGDRIKSFNNALKYAKKENKPFIYGYTDGNGKFFALDQPIKCTDLKKQTAEFQSRYKNSKVLDVAYPDKEEVKENLCEDYDSLDDLDKLLDYYSEGNDDPINMDLVDSIIGENLDEELKEEPKEPELSDFEKKKKRCIEYYNSCKEWAGEEDAKRRTSCLHGIGISQLNEWLGETENDKENK